MSGVNYLFRITPKSRQLVASAGNWGLYETVFTIERASSGDNNLVRMRHRILPPPHTQDVYVSIDEAHKRTGISERELIALCERGELEAKYVGKDWLIPLESLNKYIMNNEES